SPRRGLSREFAGELAVGSNEGVGAAHHEGDLVVSVALVGEDDDACKRINIVFNGAEGVIEPAGDLVGFEALKEEAHRLNPVGLGRSDVLLLAAGGDFDLAAAQGSDLADDRADPTVEQAEGEVLRAEQSSLVACLRRPAEDAGAAQALDAMSQADLIILLAGLEGEPDGDLLAL